MFDQTRLLFNSVCVFKSGIIVVVLRLYSVFKDLSTFTFLSKFS